MAAFPGKCVYYGGSFEGENVGSISCDEAGPGIMVGPWGAQTPDLYRVNAAILGFTITYKTAGTAKVRGSRIRHRILWVGLWVGIIHKSPLCLLRYVKFYCKKT